MKKNLIVFFILLLTVSLFAIPANLLQSGTSNIEAAEEISNNLRRDLFVDQQPDQVNGYVCGPGYGFVNADNFILTEDVTIQEIIIWGGYYPDNTPVTDDFTLIIHNDAAGLPGTTAYSESAIPVVRELTGLELFGVDEWVYTFIPSEPVILTAGTYWLEIYNTTGYPNADGWFWETGTLDPVNGIPNAAQSNNVPGYSWFEITDTELSMQVVGTVALELLPPENVAVDELTGLVTWDAPGSNVGVYWIDDMDSYTAGEYLALQSDEWVTWSGTPGGVDDGYVVDENSFSGSNSLKVEGSSTDLVHEFGSFTSGVYDVSMMMYIESGHGAYYNLLHYYNGSNSEWGMEAYFGSAGTGSLCATAQNITTFNHPVGSWFEVLCIIDLDADWAEYYVDGTFVYEWQWSIDASGNPGVCEFGATDIYAYALSGDTAMFYCDDVTISEVTTRELTGYNVYLDNVLLGNTTDLEYQLENPINGVTYVVGVSAVYDEGESEIVEISFIYTGTEAEDVVVANTMLESNYPNPFNPTTIIKYSLPKNIENTELEIYNTKGQLIKSIPVSNSSNTISWNGTDNNGKAQSSGIYLYKLNIKDSPVKKMTLMK